MIRSRGMPSIAAMRHHESPVIRACTACHRFASSLSSEAMSVFSPSFMKAGAKHVLFASSTREGC